MYLRPVCSARSTILRHSAMFVAIGTVQATCLPALSAAMAHPGVVGDGRVDVHEIDVAVREQRREIRVALRDAEVFADGVELFPVALADGVAIGVRVLLVDRDELGPEAEPDDGDVDLLGHGRVLLVTCANC